MRRTNEEVTKEMLIVAAPSEPDKYPLRLLKAELLTVELLLDIRDLLIEIRDQEHVVDFVPPNYGKQNQLVGKGEWKCPGCGLVLSLGTRHRCPGPRRRR